MNYMQHIHGRLHTHNTSDSSSDKAPFWVRHYDLITNLFTLGKTATIHRQTLSLVDLHQGDSVLDVGCGTGALALEAERLVGPSGVVVGIDVELAVIEQAQRRALEHHSQVCFEIASIDKIPYADDNFDVAFSTLMVHHLTDEQRREGIRELKRILKSNGRLVLVDINLSRRNILTSLPGHSRIEREDYVRTELADRMRETGFSIVDDGPHPFRQLSYVIGQKSQP